MADSDIIVSLRLVIAFISMICNNKLVSINLHYTFSIKLNRFFKHIQLSISFYIREWSTYYYKSWPDNKTPNPFAQKLHS
jgi:hypothetical protein